PGRRVGYSRVRQVSQAGVPQVVEHDAPALPTSDKPGRLAGAPPLRLEFPERFTVDVEEELAAQGPRPPQSVNNILGASDSDQWDLVRRPLLDLIWPVPQRHGLPLLDPDVADFRAPQLSGPDPQEVEEFHESAFRRVREIGQDRVELLRRDVPTRRRFCEVRECQARQLDAQLVDRPSAGPTHSSHTAVAPRTA